MINIVIPMAGAGSRFAKEGYLDPKPLIKINQIPMIKLVIENIRPQRPHKFIFICQKKHIESYGLTDLLLKWAPESEIIEIDGLTEGAACTVLKAAHLIDNDTPLMIANSDQYVDCDIETYLGAQEKEDLDGLIMTMSASDPKWSFVGLNQNKMVTMVVEKEVISHEATVGIYNFRRGRDFVSAAKSMIKKNLRVNNEFYVAPIYNELLTDRAKIGIYNIGEEGNGMYGLGIPQDLETFMKTDVCKRITSKKC